MSGLQHAKLSSEPSIAPTMQRRYSFPCSCIAVPVCTAGWLRSSAVLHWHSAMGEEAGGSSSGVGTTLTQSARLTTTGVLRLCSAHEMASGASGWCILFLGTLISRLGIPSPSRLRQPSLWTRTNNERGRRLKVALATGTQMPMTETMRSTLK